MAQRAVATSHAPPTAGYAGEISLVCKAHRLCVSLNSRLESNKEEKKDTIAKSRRRSVTVSVGSFLCPYGIAYRRGYEYFTRGLLKTPPRSPLCG